MPATAKPTFDAIVREHGAFIRTSLGKLGVVERELPDVEQEVLRGVDRGLAAFDPSVCQNPSNPVRSWIFGICQRQAANQRRVAQKRGELLRTVEELDVSAGDAPHGEQSLMMAERAALLHRLLAMLEPRRREVVIAYELEGLSMAEIAAAQSVPVNTAWNRLRLGREDLHAAARRMVARNA